MNGFLMRATRASIATAAGYCCSSSIRSRRMLPSSSSSASASSSFIARLLQFQKTSTRSCGILAAVQNVWISKREKRAASQRALAEGSAIKSGDGRASFPPILVDEAFLEQVTGTMQHRGPDRRNIACGIMINDKTPGKQSATFWSMGHQRLAIVDAPKTDMPFSLEFGADFKAQLQNVKLVADGTIHNHEALYNTLIKKHGWFEPRTSHSDCEVIAHACASLGPEQAVKHLDGMFAFVYLEDNRRGRPQLFAARDPVGIKPLYVGTVADNMVYVLASELKALIAAQVDPTSVEQIKPGHYWTPQTGQVRYHKPRWLFNEQYEAWWHEEQPSDDQIRHSFQSAVKKQMTSDTDYGFFLSGGVDSCVVSHSLLPMYRLAKQVDHGDDRPIPCFTVGMEGSPDMIAAKAMVDALGGPRCVDHRPRTFTADEVFGLIPKIIYHMETFDTEVIRSAIPNWLLAERASADVKMVLTGEGADELFAGYMYFMDAQTPRQLQTELRRIYNMLSDTELLRTDRMTMAHGLEARVPFLDTKFIDIVMDLDPALKMIDREAVANNAPGREKTFLRKLFEGPNLNGHSIPRPLLWRGKAMQCEGVGEDWVSILQQRVSAQVSEAELAEAHEDYPIQTPHTKEELYYRRIFEDHFGRGMVHVINPWEDGYRAAGAAWETNSLHATRRIDG